MRIALISPKGTILSSNSKISELWDKVKIMHNYRKKFSGINTSLLIIAALTPSSYEIDIIDENIEEIDFQKNYDLVGITVMTQQANRAYEISAQFRKNRVKVILGGIHVTVCPDEAMNNADSIVVGEAENLWPEIIEDFEANHLKSFYKNSKVVDMLHAPIPRYDLIADKGYNVVWIQTTRGCPHDCEFCAASRVYGNQYRRKSTSQIIDEILLIKKSLGDINISFADDNLFVDKQASIEFISAITPLKIRWFGQTDISIARHGQLLGLLKNSGCYCLFVGFESLSENNLKGINKNEWKASQVKFYPEYISKIQSYGIGVMGAFIIGFDDDTPSKFQKISDFIINNNLYESQISILTPLPGTPLRERMLKTNCLLDNSWEKYTLADLTFKHPLLSKIQLEDGLFSIYKEINSREVYLNKMRHFKQIQKKLLEKLPTD